MDVAGRAPAGRSLIRTATVLTFLVCCSVQGTAQVPTYDSQVAQAKQLVSQERWQETVDLVRAVPAPSADLDFYYGTALAHLERWEGARKAFQEGWRLQPGDERFPVELAGVAFKQKSYPEAAAYLRRALKLAPGDSYANDFLGTVYFLQSNLEAALKYWNRVDKPQIAEVQTEPAPRIDPVLLDRAFKFAPASTLRLPELLTSDVRVQHLGIFPSYRFDLQAREDGKFDVIFRTRELNGLGGNKWEALFLFFRGLPFQSVYPEIYNLRGGAVNFVSMYRWDAQKRRVLAELSGPMERNPKWRFGLSLDLRGENWNIRDSFTGPAPSLGSLNLRREALGAEIASFVSGRWNWSTGFELSHRDYRDVVPGVALTPTPSLLAEGYQLKQLAQLQAEIWGLPERRFTISGGASSQVGRIWSDPGHSFAKLQGGLRLHWFPQAEGDDYELREQIRAGTILGDFPFDELYMLGLERDNNLWMRAHIGTHDGQKGSAPLGNNYFLSNWDLDKNVYGNGLLTVKVGPFLDTGRINDPSPGLGSHKWLWDVGMEATVRVFGVGVVFSYGKDLRSGNNAFYVTMR